VLKIIDIRQIKIKNKCMRDLKITQNSLIVAPIVTISTPSVSLANNNTPIIHILTLSSLLESPIRTWHAIPRVLESENVYVGRILVRLSSRK
jgi:hypothetical protein